MIRLGVDLMFCVILITCTLVFVIVKQQRNISDLTNRLMARDYTEYTNNTQAREDPPADMKTRKPLSWYDNPNIDDVEWKR